MYKISFTGHRPKKLGDGDGVRAKMRKFLSEQFQLHPDLLVVSGGALGVDQMAAELSIELGIPFVFIFPFPPSVLSARWPSTAKNHLRALMARAVRCFVIQQSFSFRGYQVRNEVMVYHCNLLCAVYNGSPGGTRNCIQYAKQVGKNIHFIQP